MATLIELLQKAMQLHKQKQYPQAEHVLQVILQSLPEQVDALHILGLIKSQTGQSQEACRLLERALELQPNNASILGNYGIVLKQMNRLAEAIPIYRRSLAIGPSSETFFALGKAYRQLGQIADAEQAYRDAIATDASNPSPWVSLIGLLSQERRYEEALKYGLEAKSRFPKHIDVLTNLGVVYKHLRQLEKSLETYQLATEYAPNHVDLLCRIASGWFGMFRMAEGKRFLDQAEKLAPKSMEYLNAKGLYHNTLREWDLAENAFRESIALHPDNSVAYLNLSNLLRRGGNLSGALQSAQHVTAEKADDIEAIMIESAALIGLGRLEESQSLLRRVLVLEPKHMEAHQSLLMGMQYHPLSTSESIGQAHRAWGEMVTASLEPLPQRQPKHRQRKVRVGFVSGDLGLHPVGYFTLRLFEGIDRERFDTYVYSDKQGKDWLNTRIVASVTSWNDSLAWRDHELAAKIAEDEIDVLFDLAGHTDRNRLMVFARRAAPVQITWAGYVGTTGLPAMDYLLADPYHVVESMEPSISEKVLRMPHDYISYYASEQAPPIVPLPALKNGFVTFGCMGNPCKINPQVLQTWAQILQSVPKSRLLLSYIGWNDSINQRRVEEVMEAYGCGGRIQYEVRTSTEAVMDLYNQIDIALDTFPYSNGLTTCEALWMGVPTITMPGNRFSGRHSLSHMTNVGLPQFVAADSTMYAGLAMSWAQSVDELQQVRLNLREQMIHSPICDGPLFCRAWERLLLDSLERTEVR